MPPKTRRRNNKKKGAAARHAALESSNKTSATVAEAPTEDDDSDAAEGALPQEAQAKSEVKEAKHSPAPYDISSDRYSPPVAEAKGTNTGIPTLLSASAGDKTGHEHVSPAVASPIGNTMPGSSDKPSRPVTPSPSETISAKSTARPVKVRGSGGRSGPRSTHYSDDDDTAAEKESQYDRAPHSPEAKKLNFESKSGEKSVERKESEYKTGSTGKSGVGGRAADTGEFSSPQPGDEPPNGIVESFRSARKAIENSIDRGTESERKKRRERSHSLAEVLKEHPDIIDPHTGEVEDGSMVPSEEVLTHHNRTASAKELIGLGISSPELRGQKVNDISPKHGTAIALADTAKALEGKMGKLQKVERRPSLNILMDSGILVMGQHSNEAGSGHKSHDLGHLQEQQFLNAMSPTASRARQEAGGLTASPPVPSTATTATPPSAAPISPSKSGRATGTSRDVSAPAFSPPLPSSVTHIYQYIPYKILEKRVVIGLALRILSELKRRATVDDEQAGIAKLKIFRGDISVVMAVEQYACNRDLEVLVALIYDIACDGGDDTAHYK